jgi:hypothetical protein
MVLECCYFLNLEFNNRAIENTSEFLEIGWIETCPIESLPINEGILEIEVPLCNGIFAERRNEIFH